MWINGKKEKVFVEDGKDCGIANFLKKGYSVKESKEIFCPGVYYGKEN